MTTILRVKHSVPNFDDWKKIFDADPLGRKKSGMRRYRIMRQLDNTSYVMMDMEFDDQKEAEALLRSYVIYGSALRDKN